MIFYTYKKYKLIIYYFSRIISIFLLFLLFEFSITRGWSHTHTFYDIYIMTCNYALILYNKYQGIIKD